MALAGRPVHTDGRFEVLSALRILAPCTRQELSAATGIPRKLVAHRLDELAGMGLVEESSTTDSTGGRRPKLVHFRGKRAQILVAQLGGTSIAVGIADLSGTVLTDLVADISGKREPDEILSLVEDLLEQVIAEHPEQLELWGIGIGVMGPIDPTTGRPNKLFALPGWADHPVRERLSQRFGLPVWADNEVNMMAVGEHRTGIARGVDDFVYLKVGTGLGLGIVSGGTLVRGAIGGGGEIGHNRTPGADQLECFCGGVGCLVLTAGGGTLGRRATELSVDRSSPLARIRGRRPHLTAADLSMAAAEGDPVSRQLLARAGELVGRTLADAVIVLDCELVVIGGGVTGAGDLFLEPLRRGLYTHLGGRVPDLRLEIGHRHDRVGLAGAAWTVVDGILTRDVVQRWDGTGRPDPD